MDKFKSFGGKLGDLEVTVHSARDLLGTEIYIKNPQAPKTSDPYCVLTLKEYEASSKSKKPTSAPAKSAHLFSDLKSWSQKSAPESLVSAQTCTKFTELNPVYDETFNLEVTSENVYLECLVNGYHAVKTDNFLGCVEVNLSHFFTHKSPKPFEKQSFKLMHDAKNSTVPVTGEVVLSINFYPVERALLTIIVEEAKGLATSTSPTTLQAVGKVAEHSVKTPASKKFDRVCNWGHTMFLEFSEGLLTKGNCFHLELMEESSKAFGLSSKAKSVGTLAIELCRIQEAQVDHDVSIASGVMPPNNILRHWHSLSSSTPGFEAAEVFLIIRYEGPSLVRETTRRLANVSNKAELHARQEEERKVQAQRDQAERAQQEAAISAARQQEEARAAEEAEEARRVAALAEEQRRLEQEEQDRKAALAAETARIRQEQERLEREEQERLEREEQERLEAERLRLEKEEQERLEAERLRLEKEEQERLEAERLRLEKEEQERLEAERLRLEREEEERLEAERLRLEKEEQERLEAERLRLEKEEQERIAAAEAEAERLRLAKLEADRLEAERMEQLEREEAELKAREITANAISAAEAEEMRMKEVERLAAEQAEREAAEAREKAALAEAAAAARAKEKAEEAERARMQKLEEEAEDMRRKEEEEAEDLRAQEHQRKLEAMRLKAEKLAVEEREANERLAAEAAARAASQEEEEQEAAEAEAAEKQRLEQMERERLRLEMLGKLEKVDETEEQVEEDTRSRDLSLGVGSNLADGHQRGRLRNVLRCAGALLACVAVEGAAWHFKRQENEDYRITADLPVHLTAAVAGACAFLFPASTRQTEAEEPLPKEVEEVVEEEEHPLEEFEEMQTSDIPVQLQVDTRDVNPSIKEAVPTPEESFMEVISKLEILRRTKRYRLTDLFHEMDKRKDGNLRKGEMLKFLRQTFPEFSMGTVRRFGQHVDTNWDGKISYKEMSTAMKTGLHILNRSPLSATKTYMEVQVSASSVSSTHSQASTKQSSTAFNGFTPPRQSKNPPSAAFTPPSAKSPLTQPGSTGTPPHAYLKRRRNNYK